jgi:Suppressor of fused protein (SUFU)
MEDIRGIVTAHFLTHWGVPKEIHPRTVKGIGSFAVLEFGPRGKRKTWRYATNGMSSYLQPNPDQNLRIRTELYACTEKKTMWVEDFLAAIATYPNDYATYLAEGDTIDVGQAIDRNCSPYSGILLAPPGPFDPATIGLVGGVSQNILVHQVVGLLEKEIQYAQKHGGKAIWEQVVHKGEPLIDLGRPAVV